jgi:uncharacterized membrane protein
MLPVQELLELLFIAIEVGVVPDVVPVSYWNVDIALVSNVVGYVLIDTGRFIVAFITPVP